MVHPENPHEQCPLPQDTSAELDTLRERSFFKKQESAKVLLEILNKQKDRLPKPTVQIIEKQRTILYELIGSDDFKDYELQNELCGAHGIYTILAAFQKVIYDKYPNIEEFLADTATQIPLFIKPLEQTGGNTLKEAYDDAKARGGATVYIPPKPKPPEQVAEEEEKPIDPGKPKPEGKTLEERFPDVKDIARRLEEISNEEFFDKDQSLMRYREGFNWDKIKPSWKKLNPLADSEPWEKVKNPELNLVVAMAEATKEAMFYKAVTNGWGEKVLYEQHKQAMHELYRECFDRGTFRSMADWGKSVWLDVVTGTPEYRKPAPDIENKRMIKLTEKRDLFKRLTRDIANKFKKLGFGDNGYCIKWDHGDDECDTQEDDDKFNPDIIDFIQNRAILFYASTLIDEAIVENKSAKDLEKKFKDTLAALYFSAQI